jgi:hypothetical protein
MRARRITLVVTLALAGALFAGFASSSDARASLLAQTTTTAPDPGEAGNGNSEVEVAGKVVQRSPDKDAVDVAAVARTGLDQTLPLAGAGLVLLGVGLVIVDVTGTIPAKPRRTRAGLPRR